MINFKVSEILDYIKSIFTKDFLLTKVSIEGEISNYKLHNSGNVYFTLKDDTSKLNSMINKWYVSDIATELRDGDYVVCSGSVSLGKESQLTFYVDKIEKYGLGKINEKFLELKSELEKAGYFNPEHKKSLPSFPKKIGVITSPTGAAIKDIISVTRRRNSLTDILIYPALVQGSSSVSSLIEGLNYMETTDVDLVIIGRGGGSYEELNSFNSKELAMRIFDFNKSIISAVGHEVDNVISDYISDKRAGTPSMAAEIAIPNLADYKADIKRIVNRMDAVIERKYSDNELKLKNYELRIKNVSIDTFIEKILNGYLSKIQRAGHKIDGVVDSKYRTLMNYKLRLNKDAYLSRVDTNINNLNNLELKIQSIMRNRLDGEIKALQALSNKITTLDINKMLDEGYAIVSNSENKIITKVSSVEIGEELRILLSDGELTVVVKGGTHNEL